MKLQVTFRLSQRISTFLVGFFLAAQCAKAASPHGVSLVVVWIRPAGLGEEVGGFFVLTLSKPRAAVEVISLE